MRSCTACHASGLSSDCDTNVLPNYTTASARSSNGRMNCPIRLIAWLAVFPMVAACRPEPKPATDSTAPADEMDNTPTSSDGVEPRPSHPARNSAGTEQLCRSPLEPGCNPCCSEDTEGHWHNRDLVPQFCWFQEGSKTPGPNGLDPGYSAGHSKTEPCPSDCRRCAKCSLRDEQELKRVRSECDCSKPIERDPCFAPGSCGCYCSRRKAMEARCSAPQ